MKAKTLMSVKGGEIFIILIREDMKCYFNFGTNDWFGMEDFQNLHKHSNAKIKHYAESPKFKRDYKETIDVIETSKDYKEIYNRFYRDFKKDRGNRIKGGDIEIENGATSIPTK